MNGIVFASFSDVTSGNTNYEAVSYVEEHHIVDGYSDGTFRPDQPINRAELTKIVVEAYYPAMAQGSNCFPDVSAEWFSKYVCYAKTHALVGGYPDGNFKPANDINFVELAKILVNANGFSVSSSSGAWYAPYVEKLSEMKVIPSTITSFDQKVTRSEMAELVFRLMENVTDKPFTTYEDLQADLEAPGLPLILKIPSIGVDSVVIDVGVDSNGAMEVPDGPTEVAWFEPGPRPGEVGSAVISGHYGWYNNISAEFDHLDEVKIGDHVTVEDDKGNVISFVVREIRSYDPASDATDIFTSEDGKAHLNLITCGGAWEETVQQYTQRLVVFTDLE